MSYTSADRNQLVSDLSVHAPQPCRLVSSLALCCARPQAAKAPSPDLSAREVAAAQHLTEHALHLQRRQRALIGRTGAAVLRLQNLSASLTAFSAASSLPPQVCNRHQACTRGHFLL